MTHKIDQAAQAQPEPLLDIGRLPPIAFASDRRLFDGIAPTDPASNQLQPVNPLDVIEPLRPHLSLICNRLSCAILLQPSELDHTALVILVAAHVDQYIVLAYIDAASQLVDSLDSILAARTDNTVEAGGAALAADVAVDTEKNVSIGTIYGETDVSATPYACSASRVDSDVDPSKPAPAILTTRADFARNIYDLKLTYDAGIHLARFATDYYVTKLPEPEAASAFCHCYSYWSSRPCSSQGPCRMLLLL
jgi:hypothetical protein